MGIGHVDFAKNTVAYYQRGKCVLKAAVGQSDRSRDVVNMSILLTVALCVGIYLIATTGIIAKDGLSMADSYYTQSGGFSS